MKRLMILLTLLFPAAVTAQEQLRIAKVDANALSRIFGSTGVVEAIDMGSPIWGNGFLQSRYYQALPGSPAAGKYVYVYRLDLTKARFPLGRTIRSVSIPFGPANVRLDFDGDGHPDDVFMITTNAIGTRPLKFAVREEGTITFKFVGAGVPKGESSIFFGMAAERPKLDVSGAATPDSGPSLRLNAWVPGPAPLLARAPGEANQ